MSSPAPCSSRIARIDEVRGILILLVLFYHLIYDIGLFFPAALPHLWLLTDRFRLLRAVVPEICSILERIDARLKAEYPDRNLFILKDNTAHMANLSVYVSSSVNGVAQIHSELLKRDLAGLPPCFLVVSNGEADLLA